MVKIYVVRHCPTVGNAVRVFQGAIDTPLSEKGEEAKDLLSVRFRNIRLHKIYSSPQGRALSTAEGVNRFVGAPIVTVPDLREIGIGDADGLPWAEIAEKYPAFAHAWDEEPWNAVSPGGETMKEVYDRMKRAFESIVKENDGEEERAIAIVSHGCALHNLMTALLHGDQKKLLETEFLTHASVSLFTYENGKLKTEYYNDISHLPGAKKVARGRFFDE